jgi:hypothetical protein
MSTNQPNTIHHRAGDPTRIPAEGAGAAPASVERAVFSDARLALAALNWARYPVLRRVFGVSPAQVNLLTFALALSAANATYDTVRRFIRHPWPLDGPDTAIAAFLVQETGFRIAGPRAREMERFGILIAVAAIGRLTLPGVRRALHDTRVAAHRVEQQRMRIYGVAQSEAQHRTPASSRSADRSRGRRHRSFFNPAVLRGSRERP